jgi:hypothetical protein
MISYRVLQLSAGRWKKKDSYELIGNLSVFISSHKP